MRRKPWVERVTDTIDVIIAVAVVAALTWFLAGALIGLFVDGYRAVQP